MAPSFEELIYDFSLKMRLLKATQESVTGDEGVSEREILLMEILAERGKTTISTLASALPIVSESTISTDITRLWRAKELVTKNVSDRDQRITTTELTPKGKQLLDWIKTKRAERSATLLRAIGITAKEREVCERILTRAVQYLDTQLTALSENQT